MCVKKVLLCACLAFPVSPGNNMDAVAAVLDEKLDEKRVVLDFVEKFFGDISAIMNQKDISKKQIIEQLKNIIMRDLDVQSIAKFAFGSGYDKLSKDEKSLFIRSFLNMSLLVYFTAIMSYKDMKYGIVSIKKKNKGYVVHTKVTSGKNSHNIGCSVFFEKKRPIILDSSFSGVEMGNILQFTIKEKRQETKDPHVFVKKFSEEYTDEKILRNDLEQQKGTR